MANQRKTPQYSVTLYPELDKLLDRAVAVTGKTKGRLLYDGCLKGLQQILAESTADI